MENNSRKRWKILGLGVVTGTLAFFPLVFSEYDTSILAKFIVFGIFALSLNLIWGYSGIVNFGHAIFFGGGAYVTGIVLKTLPIAGATYIAIVAAIVLTMLSAAILGYFLFYGRVSGVFFGVVTLALTGVVQSIVIVSSNVTGGMNGLFAFPAPRLTFPGLPAIDLSRPRAAYYLALAAAIVCFVIARAIVRSDFGRVLRGIQENEDRIEFFGYNVPLIKLTIFTIACGMAGFAGALYVPVGFISPDLVSIERSAAVLVWVAVGGRGTLTGAFVGALVVNYLQTLLSDQFVVLWLLFIGVLSILVVLFWPDGIVGSLENWRVPAAIARLLERKGGHHAAD